jgi:protein-tyrosine-phosphatase
MCRSLGLRQNVVSYHLGRLRSESLVSRRRSSADGRDCYYAVDLDRCGQLLNQVGSALHPGLGRPRNTSGDRVPAEVLFLCSGNSARSQIAEALAVELGGGLIRAQSAGSQPKPVHPNAIRVLAARGIDISQAQSKSLELFRDRQFAYVISLCDRLREVCPEFPGHPQTVHWSIPDPGRTGDSDQLTYPAFERITDELAARICHLLELIQATEVVSRR